MKKYLYGHDSQKNAYVIEDYPYGFLRTQKRVWVETVPKKGDRVVSQTLDPKKNVWNRPKASTFTPIRFLYLDEKGHVQNTGVSPYSGFEEVKKFVDEIGGEKKLNKDQLKQYYDLSGKTLEGGDPTYTFKFDGTIKDNKVYTLDIKFDVANAVKLKHIISAIDDIIGNTKKGKYGTPAETFKQLMADKGIIRVFGRGNRIIVGPMLADRTYQQIKSHLKNKIKESIGESNNNQTSKPEGLPKGKSAFMRTEGIEKNPESWKNKVAKWEKELEKMIGYKTLE